MRMTNIRPGTSVRKCVILCMGGKKNSRCTHQVCPHCGGFQVWRCGPASQRAQVFFFFFFLSWEDPDLTAFLCQSDDQQIQLLMKSRQLFTVWRRGEEGRGGEHLGQLSRVIQPLSQSVHTSTQTLNFLPFPSPESSWSMLSEALRGCLVTTVHPDAFSSLGWTPYKKGEPVWIVMSESEEDRGDCSGDLKVLFVSKVEFWVSFPTRFGM